MAILYAVDTIVTTNWDVSLEVAATRGLRALLPAVHIYDLVRQRLADTPRRPRIVTLDERIRGDTHPDAKVILTSGDRFLARIKREFAAARDMLADDRYDEVTLELRALASDRAQPTAIDGVTTPRSSTPIPSRMDCRPPCNE